MPSDDHSPDTNTVVPANQAINPMPSENVPNPATPTTLAYRVMAWSRPVIAVFGLAIFAAAFIKSANTPGEQTYNLLVGAVISLVSTISGYYFGSSIGSQKKDDVISQALAAAQAAS